MPRLFTALEIPHNAAMSLSLLKGGLPGARWIDTENYHLTLRFIGDVEHHVADEVAHALGRIRRFEFTLGLSGLGAFGGKKPHSLFAVPTASPDLAELQAEIERICQRLRLPPDPRKFTPHVTVARLRNTPPHVLAPYLSSRGNFFVPSFAVPRFVLMSSRESVGGGPYIVEESYPLPQRVAIPGSAAGYSEAARLAT
ncbi:RNA 2',3'-cyclic phosphodiesterase [Oricola sp.]|uniref:RNA 2',3'-cyclic phosphodiesterase n=1 Tax=Oricola sp. TaxID=1979950 RepID=UPI003BAAE7B4